MNSKKKGNTRGTEYIRKMVKIWVRWEIRSLEKMGNFLTLFKVSQPTHLYTIQQSLKNSKIGLIKLKM